MRKLILVYLFVFSLITPSYSDHDIDFPEGYGKTNEVFSGSTDKTIVIIQDAHRNYECQINTIEILNSIETRVNIPLITLEGASGEFITSLYASSPDRFLTQDISMYFLKEGRLTAPEYFSMASEASKDTKLYGVEDTVPYLENLATFRKAYEWSEKLKEAFGQIKGASSQLKNKVYSKSMNELEEIITRYEGGVISFKDYFRQLLRSIGNYKESAYPAILLQKEVFDAEEKIKFSGLEDERSKLINAVSADLPPETLSDLLVQSLQFKMNRISSLRYHSFLWKLLADSKLSKDDYPNLEMYLKYVDDISKIREPQLFKELSSLILITRTSWIKNDQEKKLFQLSERLDFLNRLFGLKISNEDFDYFVDHRGEYTWDVISTSLKELGQANELDLFIPSDFMGIDEMLSVFETFYRQALVRDRVMLENTLKAMDEEKASLTVLNAGGFHTRGIAKALREKGISYRVVTPKVTLRNAQTPYFSLLLNLKNPLEKWVEPVSLGVIQKELVTAEQPIASRKDIPSNVQNVADPNDQHIFDRILTPLDVGGRLLDKMDSTGKISPVDRASVLKDRETVKLIEHLHRANDFRADFENAFSPVPNVLQIPVYKRNEKGQVVQSYFLIGRGPGARDAIQDLRKKQGFPQSVSDVVPSGRGDIAFSFDQKPTQVSDAQNSLRNSLLAGLLKSRGVDENQAQNIADKLLLSLDSKEGLADILGNAGLAIDAENVKEDIEKVLDALLEAAVSETDYNVVASLFKRYGQTFEKQLSADEQKYVRNRMRIASHARIALLENGSVVNSIYDDEFKAEKAFALTTSLFFESVEIDENGNVKGKPSTTAGEAVGILKNLLAAARAKGQSGNIRFAFVDLNRDIKPSAYDQILKNFSKLFGIPSEVAPGVPVIFVGLQEVLSELTEQQAQDMDRITQAMKEAVAEKAEIDPNNVAIFAKETEAELRGKIEGGVVSYFLEVKAGEKPPISIAIRIALDILGKPKDYAPSPQLVEVLVKAYGKTEKEVRDLIALGVTGELPMAPQPVSKASDILDQELGLGEDEIMGQSA